MNSVVLVGVLSTGLFGTLYFIPVFLQVGRNITPMNTGLAILPQAIVMMIMPLAGKAYDRFWARWPAVTVTWICGLGLFLMSGFDADTTVADVVVWTMIQAGGLRLAFMPIMRPGTRHWPRDWSTPLTPTPT